MSKRIKGWASSRKGRARAAHYVDDAGVRSMCERSPIRITEPQLKELPPDVAKRLRAMEVCDFCQNADRAERAATKRAARSRRQLRR